MKKLFVLAGLCLLLSVSYAAPLMTQQTVARTVLSEEPEPHPNTIYVKMRLNGNTVYISLLTFPYNTIEQVKSQLSGIIGVDAAYIILKYQGLELDDDLTLSFYGIGAGAVLHGSFSIE